MISANFSRTFCVPHARFHFSTDIVTACITSGNSTRNYLTEELSTVRSLGTWSFPYREPTISARRHVPGQHLWLLQIAMPTCHTVRRASCSRQAAGADLPPQPFHLATTDRSYSRVRIIRRRRLLKLMTCKFSAGYECLFLCDVPKGRKKCETQYKGAQKGIPYPSEKEKNYKEDIFEMLTVAFVN